MKHSWLIAGAVAAIAIPTLVFLHKHKQGAIYNRHPDSSFHLPFGFSRLAHDTGCVRGGLARNRDQGTIYETNRGVANQKQFSSNDPPTTPLPPMHIDVGSWTGG
jgi:hypothetical protein